MSLLFLLSVVNSWYDSLSSPFSPNAMSTCATSSIIDIKALALSDMYILGLDSMTEKTSRTRSIYFSLFNWLSVTSLE